VIDVNKFILSNKKTITLLGAKWSTDEWNKNFYSKYIAFCEQHNDKPSDVGFCDYLIDYQAYDRYSIKDLRKNIGLVNLREDGFVLKSIISED